MMPKICLNNLDHYYDQSGQSLSLVFENGAFADAHIWKLLTSTWQCSYTAPPDTACSLKNCIEQ